MVKKCETEYGVLYNADSRRLLEFVDENSVDLVYTDPPYGFNKKYGMIITRGGNTVNISDDKMKDWAFDFPYWSIDLMKDVLKDNRWGVIWLSITVIGEVRKKIEDIGLKYRNSIIWYKQGVGFTPRPNFKNAFEIAAVFTKGKMKEKWNGGSRTLNVFEEKIVSGNSKEYKMAGGHPSIKPTKLVISHIPLFTDEGDVVLDMFVGSGTIPYVAELLKRRWIGFEIDEHWFDVACKRINNLKNIKREEWF